MPAPYSFDSTAEFASSEDERDPLSDFRYRFHHPVGRDGRNIIYLTGNSLGLQPIETEAYVDEILRAWRNLGVDGHFRGENPWLQYSNGLLHQMAALVGAHVSETTLMNALTVNIHILLASFYRPDGPRSKILMESDAFPSDRYAVDSHIRFRGLNPADVIVTVEPRPGEVLLRNEDILNTIEATGSSLALVMLGGVNYYTGQLLDMQSISVRAQEHGAVVGFDLAHAAGNIPLRLHDWGVDFAAWCTYKYLNSGPGGPSGIFVHDRHANDRTLPALTGWWGQDISDRFQMLDEYRPANGAAAFQISNPSILSLAPLRASLELFEEANFKRILEKSARLTAYLEFLLENQLPESIQILTPSNPAERGAQLSICVPRGKDVFDRLIAKGVSCDWRDPDVIRMAPAPLYNSFSDVREAVLALRSAIEAKS